MSAVLYRMRRHVRRRLAATIVVTLLVAAVCAAVIAFAAGARRTSTAPDRYTTSFGGVFDALVTQSDFDQPRDREVASLAGVESVEPLTFIFAKLVAETGNEADNLAVFIGSIRAGGGIRLVEGRLADPDNRHEFVATRSFLDATRTKVGDSFELFTESQEQAREIGYDMSDPQGPRLAETLVGVVDGAAKLDDPTQMAVVSPALYDEADIATADSLMAIDLRPGVDLSTLRAELDQLPGGKSLIVAPGVLVSDATRSAVQAQARGLWILVLVAAIAAVAVLGQVITRQFRLAQDERERLSAIGFTQAQLLADGVCRAAFPIAIGSLLGGALAILPSGLFPFGFVDILEPNPGLTVDWGLIIGGTALFVVALALWSLAALAIGGRPARSVRASPSVEAVATRTGSVTAAMGVRLAYSRRSRERGSVRGAVTGVLLSVAGVVAAITFGVSLNRLVHEPFRYGANYDAFIGDNGADTIPEGIVDRLDADPDVTALTLFAGANARVGERSVPLVGVQAIRGEGQPPLLSGRMPASDDEIAFGRLTARALGVDVGGDVTMVGTTATRVLRVTGIAVIPGLGSNDGVGLGGVVTMGGLTRLDDAAQAQNVAMNLRVSREEFFSSIPEFAGGPPGPESLPASIVNVTRIRSIPFLLAAVLAVLALLTVSHAVLTSMRTRRRDLAILRSLGADRGWITRAVHWQATLLTMMPVVIGIPIGVIVGRLGFTRFADSMGALDDAAIPFLGVAAGFILVVVLANALAGLFSRTARRHEPALLLQGE